MYISKLYHNTGMATNMRLLSYSINKEHQTIPSGALAVKRMVVMSAALRQVHLGPGMADKGGTSKTLLCRFV